MSTPDPNALYVLCTLQNIEGVYRFVVRWITGASNISGQGDDLPTAEDIFYVSFERDGQWLQLDERSWGAQKREFCVRAKPFAMLDPPRVAVRIPDSTTADERWLVSTDPTGPVDPILESLRSRDNETTFPLGVCHLLDNMDKDRIAYNAWAVLRKASRKYVKDSAETKRALTEEDADSVLADAVIRMIRAGERPRRWRDIVSKEERRLRADTVACAAQGPLDDAQDALSLRWRGLGLLAFLAADEKAVEDADYAVRSGTQTRQHLRIKALQGGTLIDFWGGLDKSLPSVPAVDRGRLHDSADLLGLGLTAGYFTRDDVSSWRARRAHGSFTPIWIRVRHELDPAVKRAYGASFSGTRHLAVRGSREYSQGETYLRDEELQLSIDAGSSNPPQTPKRAWVNYDLLRHARGDISQDDPELGANTTLTFATGDGRVEILIEAASDARVAGGRITNTVIGYNVYGVWENASPGTDAWIEGASEPTLDQLRPWLISRRYSLHRDLEAALPDINGNHHPNLVEALAKPPWHPVTKLAENISDLSGGDDRLLFDATHARSDGAARYTSCVFDLRCGAQLTPRLPAGIAGAWDPVYPERPDWSAELWRGERAPRDKPQRYRFWVTAVDSMEQESAPIVVRTDDPEGGQFDQRCFRLQRRTQLAQPPSKGENDPRALSLAYLAGGKSVNVSFGTPHSFIVGTHVPEGAEPPVLNPHWLGATVQVMRRRVQPTTLGPPSILLSASAVFDSGTWRRTLARLRAEGWEYWKESSIQQCDANGLWSSSFPLDTADLSHQYISIVGFTVKPEFSSFWHGTAAMRRVQWMNIGRSRDEVQFLKASDEFIEEAPTIGSVAVSKTIIVQAEAPPRGAIPAANPFALAVSAPVLPPPSINRDLVLMRLLSQPVSEGEASLPTRPWPGPDGPALLESQIAMCEAALKRVDYRSSKASIVPPADELTRLEYSVARMCQAQEPSEPQTLRSGGLVGFRGVACISWTYVPLLDQPASVSSSGTPQESEAAFFRIFHAAAPLSEAAASSAPAKALISWHSNHTYRLVAPMLSADLLGALDSGYQPALVRISTDDSPVFATVVAVKDAATSAPLLVLEALDGALPTSSLTQWRIQIYLGKVCREVANRTFQSASRASAWVPVPGGPAEMMCWWVASVSAEQRQFRSTGAADGRLPLVSRKAEGSIQPRVPEGFRIRTVSDSDDYYYDPDNPRHKPWCPTDLDKSGAKFLPRLFLAWDPLDTWAGDDQGGGASVYVEIDRQYVRASDEQRHSLALMAKDTAWEAIRSIELLQPTEPIQKAWVDAIRSNWLLGHEVDILSAATSADPSYVRADDATRRLLASGLSFRQSKDSKDRFIDYSSQPNNNVTTVIDSDHLYRYRIRFAQDIGTNSTWRLLRSEWTEWTPYILPVAPILRITDIGERVVPIPEIVPPRVRFCFSSKPALDKKNSLRGLRRSNVGEWLYRIMVFREVGSILSDTADGSAARAWIEVGSSLLLKPDADEEIVDDGFERARYGAPVLLKYKIVLQQIIRDPASGVERPIRLGEDGFTEIKVTVPAPIPRPGGDVQEMEIERRFNVF